MLFRKVLGALYPLLVAANTIPVVEDANLIVRANGDKYTFTGSGSNALYTLTVVGQCATNLNFPPDLFASVGAGLAGYVDANTKDSGTLQSTIFSVPYAMGLFYQTAPSWYLGSFFPGDIDDAIAALQTMIGQLGSPHWVQLSLQKGSDVVGTFWYGFKQTVSKRVEERAPQPTVGHVDGFPPGSQYGC